LKKSDGERAFSESHLRTIKKYDDEHKEERNRKARERYQRKKQEKLVSVQFAR
tara:strand:- start:408 stop:566 length:159 start_codon:yes stop_codon:yes gene_type:complete